MCTKRNNSEWGSMHSPQLWVMAIIHQYKPSKWNAVSRKIEIWLC